MHPPMKKRVDKLVEQAKEMKRVLDQIKTKKEKLMSTKIGVWLDRSKAIILQFEDNKCDVVTLNSNIESARHPRCGTEGHCTIIPERKNKGRRQEIVRKFYQGIAAKIKNAGAIFILGPGMAKTEFAKELNAVKQLRSRVIGIAVADKMSLRQLESKVRNFFDSIVKQPKMRRTQLCTVKN
jgi:stalled ribosome rescue protein Dom34